jgi:hypothetical protein
MEPKIMPWVEMLPEVGTGICKERDRLNAKLAAAEELERQAAALRAEAYEGQAALMSRIAAAWAPHEIAQAKAAAEAAKV